MKRIINMVATLSVVFALGFLFTESATAQQKGTGTPKGQGQYFVDQDGDGICDNLGTGVGKKMGNGSKGKGYGVKGVSGTKGTGTGVCDGTGPKGNPNRGKK